MGDWYEDVNELFTPEKKLIAETGFWTGLAWALSISAALWGGIIFLVA